MYHLEIMPDAKWLEFLKLPPSVTFAVALAASALFAFDVWGLFYLGELGKYTRPLLIVIAVVSSVLTIVRWGEYFLTPLRERRRQQVLTARRAVRQKEKNEEQLAHREKVLAQVDHLSVEEMRYVADSLRKGTPTFYTYVHSPAVTMLLGKGLAWTPGGTHHQDYYPFNFYDYVWNVFLIRKDELLKKEAALLQAERAQKEAARRGPR